MDIVKTGLAVVIAGAVVMIGLNQYEEYKLKKKANDVIEKVEEYGAKETANLDRQEIIAKGRSDVAAIRSAIVSERQMRLLKGDSTFISKLSSGPDKLFDGDGTNTLLAYSIKPGNGSGEWNHPTENTYELTIDQQNNEKASFLYNSSSGEFSCMSPSELCTLLD